MQENIARAAEADRQRREAKQRAAANAKCSGMVETAMKESRFEDAKKMAEVCAIMAR